MRSFIIAVAVAAAFATASAAAGSEARNALANSCTARGGTTDWSPFPADGTVFCRLDGGSSDDAEFTTDERASQGFLAPEKICQAAGGEFALVARSTSGGTLVVFGWGCRLPA